MAQLSHHGFGWVGNGFNPGVEHAWSLGPISFTDVLQVTAHAVQLIPRELMVKDVRTHVDGAGNRSLLFTVRNTGVNNIAGYRFSCTIVKP